MKQLSNYRVVSVNYSQSENSLNTFRNNLEPIDKKHLSLLY